MRPGRLEVRIVVRPHEVVLAKERRGQHRRAAVLVYQVVSMGEVFVHADVLLVHPGHQYQEPGIGAAVDVVEERQRLRFFHIAAERCRDRCGADQGSVLGEVNTPSRFPVSYAGEKILDEITRAGGPKGQGFDTWVMLERDGKRATIPFGALVYEPSNNIYARPNDTIYVYQEPQTFVAFGAQGTQGQFNFGAWRISLAEAQAKAGGLNDTLADPASVFIYRGETREVAERLGLDVSKFQGPLIPVVYNVNYRDPAGYFLATKFQMRNKDVLFASNASAVEQAKVMNYIRLVTATANDPIVASTNALVLRSTIRNLGP